MTAHVHDPAVLDNGQRPAAAAPIRRSMTSARPWWVLPVALTAIVVGGLVVTGVLSLSTVIYVGLFGGMILMHTVGHGGHGGHGDDAGRGHSLHGDGADGPDDLSNRSSGAQPGTARSVAGLGQRARADSTTTSETEDHDQRNAHGCH